MIGNMVEAEVKIEGVRPLLYHAFSPAALPLERQEKAGVPGNNPEEWQDTVLFDAETRQLYLPHTYFFACLREGGRYTPVGRSNYMTKVSATLVVLDDRVFLEDRFLPDGKLPQDPNQPVYLDIRGVRNPNTNGQNVRYRVACQPGWTCTFHIRWDRSIIDVKTIQSILTDAGTLVGIADGRRLGLGRFKVVSFTVSEEALAAG